MRESLSPETPHGNGRAHDAAPGLCREPATAQRIEEVFGWVKSSAGLRQTKFPGVERVGWSFSPVATAYNLIRLPRLLETPA